MTTDARKETETRPLTEQDKEAAFIQATSTFCKARSRWAERFATGMTDDELAEALAYELGIMGGRGGPDCISLAYQGAGLKIWASWDYPNMYADKPLFEGKATIAMARRVYGIPDPNDRQLSFL